MNKKIMNLGMFSILSIMPFFLTSCNKNNDVILKDNLGNEYKVNATTDTDEVYKVLESLSKIDIETSNSIEFDLAYEGKFTYTQDDFIKISLDGSIDMDFGMESKEFEYKKYNIPSLEDETNQNDVTEAKEAIIDNFDFLLNLKSDLNLGAEDLTSDQSIREEVELLNGKPFRFDLDAQTLNDSDLVYLHTGEKNIIPTALITLLLPDEYDNIAKYFNFTKNLKIASTKENVLSMIGDNNILLFNNFIYDIMNTDINDYITPSLYLDKELINKYNISIKNASNDEITFLVDINEITGNKTTTNGLLELTIQASKMRPNKIKVLGFNSNSFITDTFNIPLTFENSNFELNISYETLNLNELDTNGYRLLANKE